MSIYTLNYGVFANEFLPPDKRAEVQKSWLMALLAPEQTLHDEVFLTYRPDVVARSKQNGQKIIMESILNETFGVVTAPFIYIDNTGDDKTPKTFFNKAEGYPPVIFTNSTEGAPVFFVNSSELTQNNKFKVFVPLAVYNTVGEPKIAAEVDRLRPYSTTYEITTF